MMGIARDQDDVGEYSVRDGERCDVKTTSISRTNL